jgi:hypothetical protein
MDEKIELRAAAARLLYENDRKASDYAMIVDYINNSKRIVNGKWHRTHTCPNIYSCSVCGDESGKRFQYCPSCLALMENAEGGQPI